MSSLNPAGRYRSFHPYFPAPIYSGRYWEFSSPDGAKLSMKRSATLSPLILEIGMTPPPGCLMVLGLITNSPWLGYMPDPSLCIPFLAVKKRLLTPCRTTPPNGSALTWLPTIDPLILLVVTLVCPQRLPLEAYCTVNSRPEPPAMFPW